MIRLLVRPVLQGGLSAVAAVSAHWSMPSTSTLMTKSVTGTPESFVYDHVITRGSVSVSGTMPEMLRLVTAVGTAGGKDRVVCR